MEPGEQSNYHPVRPAQYTDIIAYVYEKYGVKVNSGYVACVKRMCGLSMEENRNKSKKGLPPRKPYCPAKKVEYIKDALRHFGILTE